MNQILHIKREYQAAPKFTPGPWYLKPASYGFDVWGNLHDGSDAWVGPVKRLISPHSKVHSGKDICADADETEATARLITAAPDMYAALRECAPFMEMLAAGGGAARKSADMLAAALIKAA